MESRKQDRQIIDRYLADQLTGSDLEDFMQHMQDDPAFRESVTLHAMLQKGIETAHDKKYSDLIVSSVRFRKTLLPNGLMLIFIFLIITLCGSLLWFYLAPDTGNNVPKFSLFDNFKSSQPETPHKGDKKKSSGGNEGNTVATVTTETTDSIAVAANQDDGIAAGGDSTATAGMTQPDDIVVKKDEMLISADVAVTDLNDKKTQEDKDGLSNSVVEKLNPAAGLPEKTNTTNAVITTEFWVSPINYKGYRFLNNKLILFGIEEPDRVKLYRMKDNLYMSYQNAYFRILPSDDFVSYQKIRETDVPLAIRSSK